MNYDIHEIRIFESDRGPSERRFIQSPTGRPLAPQYPAQFAAVFSQAFAFAFGLEEMLIPEDALKRWRDGGDSQSGGLDSFQRLLIHYRHRERAAYSGAGWRSRDSGLSKQLIPALHQYSMRPFASVNVSGTR